VSSVSLACPHYAINKAERYNGESCERDGGQDLQEEQQMSEKDLIPVTELNQIPENMTEAEEAEFWSTHCFTEELWEKLEPVPEEESPSVRIKPSKGRGG
jgi:hypothetical protein